MSPLLMRTFVRCTSPALTMGVFGVCLLAPRSEARADPRPYMHKQWFARVATGISSTYGTGQRWVFAPTTLEETPYTVVTLGQEHQLDIGWALFENLAFHIGVSLANTWTQAYSPNSAGLPFKLIAFNGMSLGATY